MMISGTVDPHFSRVRDVFLENFEAGDELGAACALMVDGWPVVNLIGGYQDRKKTTSWQDDTIVTVYSSGKAVIALLMAGAVSRGLVKYEEKVATYWPEFAQAGKEDITVAHIMSHQGGLPGFVEPIDPALWLDWDGLCQKLAEMPPLWPVGTQNGYHPQTYGYLAGEVLRRVTRMTVGELVRERFYKGYGLNVHCGLRDEELARASSMTKPTRAPDLGAMNDYKKAAFLAKWASASTVSREEWVKAEIPAANMHADALSLARLMSVIANDGRFEGERWISSDALAQMMAEQCKRDDVVLPFNISWACGMMRNSNKIYGPVEEALGHSGFGGSCVVADPVNRVSFSYVMNKMSHHLVGDPRTVKLLDAVYACL